MLDAGVTSDAAEIFPDAEIHADAESDAAIADDSGEDAGTVQEDAATFPDAEVTDATNPDATTPDAGDAGVVLTDQDNDNIADQHEGMGAVNTDGDADPDTADLDSDNDGVSDLQEAGDTELATLPVDSDNDGVPNFRDSDSNNNGIPDGQEGSGDLDGDGIPDFMDMDVDGDFIREDHEGAGDFDGDGTPNNRDLDSDNDGVSDAVEAGDQQLITPPNNGDFVMDGPDFIDLDADNDTIGDVHEGAGDSDGDTIPDRLDIDSDNDAVLDLAEAGDADVATPPLNTDGDANPDFRDTDADGDFILDLTERNIDSDNDSTPDRLDSDSDNDGVSDVVESGDTDLATLPLNTDLDTLADYLDLDSDNDGLADAVELGCPGSSNRVLGDSDLDGFVDAAELAYGSNPCSGLSGIDDFYFVLPPGGPGDDAPLLFSDTGIDRADLAINMDNTGSMGEEIANLRTSLSTTLIPGVLAVIPDTGVAVTSFEDFPIDPFGDLASGDVPFRLNTRVTTSIPAAQTAVNALTTRSGVDFPESGAEALFQIASGAGVSYPNGSVPAFNPAQNNVPGVADGVIGGVGFRDDALPIVVHVTDALSHTRRDYQAVNTNIAAAAPTDVRNALSGIGARVVTMTGLTTQPFNDLLCSGQLANIFGAIGPNDADWFVINGAVSGDSIHVEVGALSYGSELDTMVAIANSTGIIALNDDVVAGNTDSELTATLSGVGPYYVAIASYNDNTFTGIGGQSQGHYAAIVERNGAFVIPSPTQCRAEDANSRTSATQLVAIATSMPPGSFAQCLTDCQTILGPFHPLFEDYTYPVEYSEETNAVIPACAWNEFGPGRPASCPLDQCCTGINGEGVPVNAAGVCPLTFEISANGAGLSTAMVAGIEALVKFSTFTITTVVRSDPSAPIDTTCFIHGVTPATATVPNSCAPTPQAVDLLPPSPALDSFINVVPGTLLEFDVDALNQNATTLQPCAPSTSSPQLYRAFIDVIADGVTVVDTRDVIIIVPPVVSGGPS